jgi:hypothetical protein
MDKLHFLLSNLSGPQWKMLLNYLRYFSVRKDADTQLIRLAEIIRGHKETSPSLDDCSRLLYGKMNYNAIQKAKSRLQRKVENLLLLDTGTEKRSDELDELDKNVIQIRRKVTLFHIILLHKTDTKQFLNSEMEEIIRLSRKYELYSTLVEQLKYKKWMYGLRQGKKIFSEINKEIAFYQRCNDALNKAADCYYLAVIRSVHSSKSDLATFRKFLRESIGSLRNEFQVTQSPLVFYYTKQLEIMLYDSENDLEAARTASLEMIRIINEHKSVFRKQRLAVAYDHLASCEIRSGNYESAAHFALDSKKYCKRNTVNYYAAIEYEFLARFYQDDLNGSQRLSQELLRSVKKEMGDFLFAKYLFYQSNVLYMQQKFKETLRLLNYKLQLSKDKQGWDVSIRILKIQTLIELGRLDEASTQVISLLKHADRSFSGSELKPREKLIIRTLRMLNREGFSASRIRVKIKRFTAVLTENPAYQWEPLSSELIPFEKWMDSHYFSAKKISVEK